MTLNIAKIIYISRLLVRSAPGTGAEVSDFIRETFADYNPMYFEVASYEDIMKSMYSEEARFGIIVMVFGIVALIVAMLGVFGLSLFLSNELRFDTAIYRVFGASGRDIINQNTWRYMIYVGLGNIISIPLVVIFMNRWLQQFAFRVSIGPLVFVVAFLLSAIVFVATTSINTRRLANINPVDNIRQE